MKILFSKKTIVILALAVCIAATSIVAGNTTGGGGIFTDVSNAIAKPLKTVMSSVARTFETIYGIMYRYEKVMAENEALKMQISSMRQDYLEYTEMAEENARLREFLGFTARFADRVYDSAVVIEPGASNWSSSFTISKGTANSDIEKGDIVITESGTLVGRVTEVFATTSTAISVIDTTFAAAVTVGAGGTAATVKGDFTLMRRGMLMLDRIADNAAVLPGDIVITSGKGGVYPSGLTVGVIFEVFDYPTGVGRYASVVPSVELESVSHVYVITDFDIMD